VKTHLSLKSKLLTGEPLLGSIVSLSSPSVAEMLAQLGYDWLWIDMEHAPLSLDQVQAILQACCQKCFSLVRIPVNDEVWIKRVLDLGPSGIIVPQVNSAQEAEKAIKATQYPPKGTRSVGIARANAYGITFNDYIDKGCNETTVLLQIEHVDAVKSIEAILAVQGLGGIIIGPYDLSGSYGKLGKLQDEEIEDAIETVRQACQKAGIPCGIFALQPESAQEYLKRGFNPVAIGIDAYHLWTAAKASLSAAQASLASLSAN
jgi:2-keto-3-deoxy-L-rhamnonate aldolase RhmA